MLILILTVCLMGDPAKCQKVDPMLDPMMPPACAIQGQQLAHDWLNDHPEYRLAGWRCERPSDRWTPA